MLSISNGMKNDTSKINQLRSWIISAIIAILFVVTATIVGELYSPFKNWLKEMFYHHWIGKGVLSVVIFVLLGFILKMFTKENNEDAVSAALYVLFWISLISALSIIGFYLYEVFVVSH